MWSVDVDTLPRVIRDQVETYGEATGAREPSVPNRRD